MNELIELLKKFIVGHYDTIETWLHNLHYECEAKKKIQPTFITDCALHTENIPVVRRYQSWPTCEIPVKINLLLDSCQN